MVKLIHGYGQDKVSWYQTGKCISMQEHHRENSIEQGQQCGVTKCVKHIVLLLNLYILKLKYINNNTWI